MCGGGGGGGHEALHWEIYVVMECSTGLELFTLLGYNSMLQC